MTSSATPELKVECPDYDTGVCRKVGCPRFLVRISKQGVDEEGNQLFGGACMLNGDIEWFDGCLPFQGEIETIRDIPSTNGNKSWKGRHRGKSIFDGITVHQDIESDSSKQFIKVNNREFKLTRTVEWVIVDRMLGKIKDFDYGFTIDLSTKEHNGMSDEGKAFVSYCLDRERVAKKTRATKYTGKARIKPGLLKPSNIR